MSLHFDVRDELLAAGQTSPSRQLVPSPDDPYMEVVQTHHSEDTLTSTQPTSTTPTDPVSTSPFLHRRTSAHRSSLTQTAPLSSTLTIRRTARMSVRVPGYRLRYSDLPASPPKRTRSVYMGTSSTPVSLSPASSPDRSPPHQRLRRASDTDSEEDPQEDSEEEQEEPVQTEPTQDGVVPVEHAPEDARADRDMDLPVGLDQEMTVPQVGEMVLEDVPDTFEIGQSSRAAQIQGSDDTQWVDIECVASTAVRAASPDYTPSSPSFVPPSPSPAVSPLPAASPAEEEELTVIERILIQLGSHESLLDVHTDQLERLQPARFQGYERRVDTIDRAACVLFESTASDRQDLRCLRTRVDRLEREHGRELRGLDSRMRGQGRGFTGLHGRVEDLERTQWISRDTARIQWQRITALDSMLATEMRYGRESRRRIEELEATQRELIAGIERLRRGRGQA